MKHVIRKMKIMLVVDKLVYHGATINGPSRYYSWMLENIDRDNFDITLVSLRQDSGADHLFERSGHKVVHLNCHKYDVTAFVKIAALVEKLHIDLMHLSGYAACTLGRIAALFTNTPVIVHEHWADPNLPFYITAIESVLSARTTHAIAVSELAKITLTKGKKIPEHKVSVIRNGIPLDRFGKTTLEQAQAFRAEIGVSEDTMLIGMVAMLEKNKGHEYVIEAMASVADQFPQAKLLIIGEGEERPRLTQQIQRLGLADHVLMLGSRDDIAIIDKALDIFVVGSFRETASLVAVEAMASGCALITTDCGGPTEFVRNNENGLVVPVKNSGAMSYALLKLLADPELRQRLANQAKLDSEQFDVRNMTRRIEALYRDLTMVHTPGISPA